MIKYRFPILGFFLIAAIVCYFLGSPSGGSIFIFLGMGFEGFFWLGVLHLKRQKRMSDSNSNSNTDNQPS